MKRIGSIGLIIVIYALIGCSKHISVETLEINEVEMFSASLEGIISNPDTDDPDLEFGFEISLDETFPEKLTKKLKVETYNPKMHFSYTITGKNSEQFHLKQGTTYFVRSYMVNQKCLYKGEIESFTTKEMNVETGEIDESSFFIKSFSNIQQGSFHKIISGVCFGTTNNPDVTDYFMKSEQIDEEGNFSTTLQLVPCGKVYYRAMVLIDDTPFYGDTFSFIKEPSKCKPIDLNLPSGTLWATYNVGAENPWEYGCYFAWGETRIKNNYSLDTYSFANKKNRNIVFSDHYTKYTKLDENELEPEDDAAYVYWGSKWRMPSNEQIKEICDSENCTWTWVDNYNNKNVSGRICKSKRNDNEIFFPAAGIINSEKHLFINELGNYWSLTNAYYFEHVAFLHFNSYECCETSRDNRYIGKSIRPIYIGK